MKVSQKAVSLLLACMLAIPAMGMPAAATGGGEKNSGPTAELQTFSGEYGSFELKAETQEVKDSGKLEEAIEAVNQNGGGKIVIAADIDFRDDDKETEDLASDKYTPLEISATGPVTIDFQGHTVEPVLLSVQDGAKVILDDTSSGKTGGLKNGTYQDQSKWHYANTIQVENGGTLTIENGTYTGSNTVVYNQGTLTINDGTFAGTNSGYGVRNVYPKEEDSPEPMSFTLNGGTITASKGYGVVLFGKGVKENETPDNGSLTFTMTGGKIGAVVGIGTNANSGKNAGYTMNLSGGEVEGSDTGMYLPSNGIVNISGGIEIYGKNQGVRVCAGELNISGGRIYTDAEQEKQMDIQANGTGEIPGALVIGKAGNGYEGDLIVNITGGTIENTAEGAGDAIITSDRLMGQSNAIWPNNYAGLELRVNVSGAETKINGDVRSISTIVPGATSDGTKDGGSNVSVTLDGVTVTGNVENASYSPIVLKDSTVTGTVTVVEIPKEEGANDSEVANLPETKITAINSKMASEPKDETNPGEGEQTIVVVGCETNNGQDIEDKAPAENKFFIAETSQRYDTLSAAISALQDGNTLVLPADTSITVTGTQVIDEDGVTVYGMGPDKTKITATECTNQAALLISGAGVTLQNFSIANNTDTTDQSGYDAIKFASDSTPLEGGTIEKVTAYSEKGHALNIHGVDGMVVDQFTSTGNGKLSVSIANSPKVSLSNITTAKSDWNFDIGIMLGNPSTEPYYGNAVNLTISGTNDFANKALVYSENTRADNLDGGLDTITFVGEDGEETQLYKLKVPKGDVETNEQYYYVTEETAKNLGCTLVAFSDDGTDHPLVYTSLEAALNNASDPADNPEKTVTLLDDVAGGATIDKDVTIDGGGHAISGTVTVADGTDVAIQNADLSDAEFAITGTANLSGNYWGDGVVPQAIEGATITTYFPTMDAMTQNQAEIIGNQLEGAATLLQNGDYTVSSSTANTLEAVAQWVAEKVEEILKQNSFKGTFSIEVTNFTAAQNGTSSDRDGTDGSFDFTVTLTYAGNTKTVSLNGTITARAYSRPSSSGGGGGGGDYHAPGIIVPFNPSLVPQPEQPGQPDEPQTGPTGGSLLLDTLTYTMAPGGIYDILMTLQAATPDEVRVYSSRENVASVADIGGGKFRVTALADGETYIMFEVWRNGEMLTHASVKVTVAEGAAASGVSNRAASVF